MLRLPLLELRLLLLLVVAVVFSAAEVRDTWGNLLPRLCQGDVKDAEGWMRNITERNIERGLVLRPDMDWIAPIARQGGLRVLMLGGSNTASKSGYAAVFMLNFRDVFDDDAGKNQSYCINGGISGHPPQMLHFEFEDNLPPDQWPNLVTLEFSVNMNAKWHEFMMLDKVIFFMNTAPAIS